MAKRVVIDVVAQFKDETQGVQKVSKNLDNLEKAGKRARNRFLTSAGRKLRLKLTRIAASSNSG